jgi:hypothetical protein
MFIGALVPTVTATYGSYTGFSTWSDISPEATPQNARRGILAELQGRDGAWRVVLSTVTPNGTESVGATPPAATLGAAADAVATLMDESWKQASIVRECCCSRNFRAFNSTVAVVVRSPS